MVELKDFLEYELSDCCSIRLSSWFACSLTRLLTSTGVENLRSPLEALYSTAYSSPRCTVVSPDRTAPSSNQTIQGSLYKGYDRKQTVNTFYAAR